MEQASKTTVLVALRSKFDQINAQLNGSVKKDRPSKYEAIIDSYPLKIVDGNEYPVAPSGHSTHFFVREQGVYWLDTPIRFIEDKEGGPFFTPIEEYLISDFLYVLGVKTVYNNGTAFYFELRRDDIHGLYKLFAMSRPESDTKWYTHHVHAVTIEFIEGLGTQKEELMEYNIRRFVEKTFSEYDRLKSASDHTASSPDQTN